MRKNILLILFVACYSINMTGQETGNITGRYYITNIDVVVNSFNIIDTSRIVEPIKLIAKAGTMFTAYEVRNNNKLLIKFWNYTTNDSIGAQGQSRSNKLLQELKKSGSAIDKYQYISYSTNGLYFLMDIEDFNKKTSEYYGKGGSLVYGFTTIPFKLRFGGNNRSFQYSSDFSLGINFGYEWNISARKKQSFGILLGIGVSSINIDPESVNNYIDKSTSAGAFTPSLGFVYSYESFQIGAFIGFDLIPGEMGKNWIYKNKPWLGIGAGFTIFQKNKTENKSNGNQK